MYNKCQQFCTIFFKKIEVEDCVTDSEAISPHGSDTDSVVFGQPLAQSSPVNAIKNRSSKVS